MVEGEQADKYSRVSIVEELPDLGLQVQLEPRTHQAIPSGCRGQPKYTAVGIRNRDDKTRSGN